MSREEEEIAIQCNASNQNISVQYSVKPYIEQLEEDLPGQDSLEDTNREE